MTDPIVTQEDRDGAAKLLRYRGEAEIYCQSVERGEQDAGDAVQAFARHRLAAEKRGYDRAVDDLRKYGWASGHYTIQCLGCDKILSGADKRAIRCPDCAADTQAMTDEETPSRARDYIAKEYYPGQPVRCPECSKVFSPSQLAQHRMTKHHIGVPTA